MSAFNFSVILNHTLKSLQVLQQYACSSVNNSHSTMEILVAWYMLVQP